MPHRIFDQMFDRIFRTISTTSDKPGCAHTAYLNGTSCIYTNRTWHIHTCSRCMLHYLLRAAHAWMPPGVQGQDLLALRSWPSHYNILAICNILIIINTCVMITNICLNQQVCGARIYWVCVAGGRTRRDTGPCRCKSPRRLLPHTIPSQVTPSY